MQWLWQLQMEKELYTTKDHRLAITLSLILLRTTKYLQLAETYYQKKIYNESEVLETKILYI
jgi:hypothetical protein